MSGVSGEIRKRKKKLSKKYYGTSHTVSLEEAEFVHEKGNDLLVVGTGQNGKINLITGSLAVLCPQGLQGTGATTPAGHCHLQPGQGPQDRPVPCHLLTS